MAFREDAFSLAITPAGEQQPEKKTRKCERVLQMQIHVSRSLARERKGSLVAQDVQHNLQVGNWAFRIL